MRTPDSRSVCIMDPRVMLMDMWLMRKHRNKVCMPCIKNKNTTNVYTKKI